jgi:DeoR family ulaG and ulaABCDEF operon transcriptional repressor
MVDSRKLRARSSTVVAPLERIDMLVTDEGARDEELAPIRDAGVHVVVAPVLPEDRALESAA